MYCEEKISQKELVLLVDAGAEVEVFVVCREDGFRVRIIGGGKEMMLETQRKAIRVFKSAASVLGFLGDVGVDRAVFTGISDGRG